MFQAHHFGLGSRKNIVRPPLVLSSYDLLNKMSHNRVNLQLSRLTPPNYIKSTLDYPKKICQSTFHLKTLCHSKWGGSVSDYWDTLFIGYLVILSKPCQIILLDETRLHHRSSKARTPVAEDFKFSITLTSQLQNGISTIIHISYVCKKKLYELLLVLQKNVSQSQPNHNHIFVITIS